MKKNLLALFALSGVFSTTYAQDTYINDAVIVKVNPNTLFYNGGSVSVKASSSTTDTTEKVINEGNIQIEGNFSNTNTTGKNFVNRYNSTTSYGQLRINSGKNVTGKVVLERVKPDITKSNEYLIGLPFQNVTAKDLINTLTGTNFFSGECAVNVDCGTSRRARQTMLVWDIAETEYDAVPSDSNIEPYKRYLLQFKNNNSLVTAINSLGSVSKIGFTGYPNNKLVNVNLKSGWKTGQNFADQTYGNWKNNRNNYNLTYYTYLGNNNDTSYLFGKNLHRIANPYTSNLDLSNVNKGSSWITFNTPAGVQSPTEAFDTTIKFQIVKNSNGFSIMWNPNTGSVSNGDVDKTEFKAWLIKDDKGVFRWGGNPIALLIRPYETFHVYYNSLNRTNNNNNRIISTTINLSDANKTFAYNLYPSNVSKVNVGTTELNSKSKPVESKLTTLLKDEELKKKGLVTDVNFRQLELFLTNKNDNIIQGSPVYLLNADFMKTGDSTNKVKVSNPIFFYEENENGDVLTDSETMSNEFNSENYIGKPIRIGFNNLSEGTNYRLNFNLYDYSILNKVKKFDNGKYYLLDKLTNKVTEVDELTEISFTANDKINDRFEFYWNAKPNDNLNTDNLNKANTTTYVYSDKNRNQFVRFEQPNTTANIIVYDLTGRQIFSKNDVSTNSDYQLNLNNTSSIYIIKVIYKDGKTVTKKTIRK